MSPFQNLTRDVLIEIFIHLSPEGDVPRRPSVFVAPLQIARVCSWWRSVAISYSRLWCSIRIGLKDDQPIEGRNHAVQDLMALQEFLKRSNDLPMTLTFVLSSIESSFKLRINSGLYREVLVTHSERWKSLSVFGDKDMINSVIYILGEGAPMLEYLELDAGDSDLLDPQDTPIRLRNVPNLKKMRLGRDFHRLCFTGPLTPSTNLRYLKMDYYPNMDDLRCWLPYLPRLKTLLLYIPALLEDIVPQTDHLAWRGGRVVHRLTLLFICVERFMTPVRLALLDHLQIPNLRILIVHVPALTLFGQIFYGRRLYGLLEASLPPLRVLIMRQYNIQSDTLLDILKLVPSLELLDVWVETAGQRVLEALTLSEEPPNMICPRLQCLMMTIGEDTSTQAVVRLITSRWRNQGSHIGTAGTFISGPPVAHEASSTLCAIFLGGPAQIPHVDLDAVSMDADVSTYIHKGLIVADVCNKAYLTILKDQMNANNTDDPQAEE